MVLKVVSDYFLGDFVSGGSGEVSVFPEFTAPEFFLHFRVFGKDYAGADTFQNFHHPGDAIAWWKREKNVDMVFGHFQHIYFKIMVCRNLLKNILHRLLDIAPKNPLAVLRRPDKVIFGVI